MKDAIGLGAVGEGGAGAMGTANAAAVHGNLMSEGGTAKEKTSLLTALGLNLSLDEDEGYLEDVLFAKVNSNN